MERKPVAERSAQHVNGLKPLPTNLGLAATIAENVREMIVRGTLSPLVHLGQEELAQRFGVSRIPVREALKLLAAEGVIVHDPNRGFFVASLSSEEARQLYRVRHLVERDLLTRLAWPSDDELKNLHKLLDELEALVDDGLRRDWSQRHRDFHRVFMSLSDQKIIVREAERLWVLTDRYRSLLPPPAGTVEAKARMVYRRKLLEALAKRDRDMLISVFEAGRDEAGNAIVRILQNRGL